MKIIGNKIALKSISVLLLFVTGLFVFACSDSGEDNIVNVYSHRHYDIDKQLFREFTDKTGIQVNVVSASADELIKKLEIEGLDSPADLLITVDAGRLHRAKEKGLLQAIQSNSLDKNIPLNLRDPEGYWYGLTIRARLLVYSKDRVNPERLSSYDDLTKPNWQGKILCRSSGNIYNQSLLASMIATQGKQAAKQWAEKIVKNFARDPKGNDRDQMKAIAAGIGDVAIVNSYYVGKMITSSIEEERKVAEQIGVFFPDQNGRGTHINTSGAGVTASAKHKENAIQLIEFLSNLETQEKFAEGNFEYPVNPNAKRSALLESWGEFKADTLNLALLGKYNREAVMLFDEVGWK